MPGSEVAIRIERWHPRYAADFDRLNRWWLEKYFTVEPLDEEYLKEPERMILAPGGEIFFAIDAQERVVGTVGAAPHGTEIELLKLGVDPAHHGQGTGRILCEAVITYARERGYPRLHLVTNSGLKAALRLYERLGFAYKPFPFPQPYIESDVYMELPLV